MKTITVTFSNHAPINFTHATEIAATRRDGGCYDGFGHDIIKVMQGKNMIHIYRSYSSGCDYNGRGADHSITYLFGARTREEVIAWLLREQKKFADSYEWEYGYDGLPEANELLISLGYQGEEA